MFKMSTYNIHSCGFDRNLFRVWIGWFEFILRCCSQSCWSCPIKHSAFPALDLYTSFNPIEFHWMIIVCSMLTLSSLCGLFFVCLFDCSFQTHCPYSLIMDPDSDWLFSITTTLLNKLECSIIILSSSMLRMQICDSESA